MLLDTDSSISSSKPIFWILKQSYGKKVGCNLHQEGTDKGSAFCREFLERLWNRIEYQQPTVLCGAQVSVFLSQKRKLGAYIWGSYNVLREDKMIVPDQIEHFLPLGLEWWTTCQHVEEQDAKSPPRKPLISIPYERSR